MSSLEIVEQSQRIVSWPLCVTISKRTDKSGQLLIIRVFPISDRAME